MWWSRLFGAALLLATGACGFQPLYGTHGVDQPGAQAQLETVRIEPIADRTGQQLYNSLRDELNPRGKPSAPVYFLSVELDEEKDTLFIRRDETSSRANLTLKAKFSLRRADTGEPVLEGTSRSVSSYDILNDEFATVASEQDARYRSARELSDDIRTRLAIYFSKPPAGAT